MSLNTFSLQGRVAIVTGCDTGLGQGMAVGLAEAGCDIVGINIVEPTETHGINVNAIAPGYMATNNTQPLRADEKRNGEIVDRIPASRWGRPEDMKGPGGVSGLARFRLCAWLYAGGRRRLAGTLRVKRQATGRMGGLVLPFKPVRAYLITCGFTQFFSTLPVKAAIRLSTASLAMP